MALNNIASNTKEYSHSCDTNNFTPSSGKTGTVLSSQNNKTSIEESEINKMETDELVSYIRKKIQQVLSH